MIGFYLSYEGRKYLYMITNTRSVRVIVMTWNKKQKKQLINSNESNAKAACLLKAYLSEKKQDVNF